MRNLAATLLFVLICPASYGQNSSTQQPSGTSATTPATTNDSSSQQPKPPVSSLPDDSTTSGQGQAQAPQDKKEGTASLAKHKLGQLAPDCINIFAYRRCWSVPDDGNNQSANTDVDAEYAKDMEVGGFYLNERKNYMGAAMRFQDALDRKPSDPAATYMLAQSLEGLHQIDEARQVYEVYLKLDPKGKFATQARKALDSLKAKDVNADANKPK